MTSLAGSGSKAGRAAGCFFPGKVRRLLRNAGKPPRRWRIIGAFPVHARLPFIASTIQSVIARHCIRACQQGLNSRLFRRTPGLSLLRSHSRHKMPGRRGTGLNIDGRAGIAAPLPHFHHFLRWGFHHARSCSLPGPVSRSRMLGRVAPDRPVTACSRVFSGFRASPGSPQHPSDRAAATSRGIMPQTRSPAAPPAAIGISLKGAGS